MTQSIGIDFGTTNSAVAVNDGKSVALAQFHRAIEPLDTFRSVVYFPEPASRTAKRVIATGPAALDLYLAQHADGEGGGRLVQSVKSLLASRVFTNTLIGGRRYMAEDLVMLIVRGLKTEAEEQFGKLRGPIVAGRPVRFVSAETEEDDALAVERLRGAFRAAGWGEVVLEYEPAGAAYFYEARLDHDELILIADFGGGTSDFSLLPVGPSLRTRRRMRKVVATEGVPLAGDAFDARIVRHVVSPMLGEGSFYRSLHKTLPVPASLYRKLERWHHLSFLRSPETMRTLKAIETESLDPEKIAKLIALVESDLGFQLHRAVQQTKLALSREEEAMFIFRHPAVSIERKVTRSEFEEWIAEDLARIEDAVEKLLRAPGASAAAVDRVFLTGGSSLVPAVRRLFERRFGADKISGGDEFTSVAKGLALRAADLR